MRFITKLWMPSLVLLLAFLSIGQNCQPPATVNHNLQVQRFTTSSLTNARADAIMADMGQALQTDNGSGDVACSVSFTRAGHVTTFATGNGIVNSQANFNAVNSLPGNIKVVNQINWCGALIPNVIGCAPVPGNSLVVVRFTANQEDILWAHEYGHNKGLSHRNVANALMNGTININNNRVNQAECNAFSTAPATTPAPVTKK